METRRTQRIWVELALRAEKDAKAIKAAEELSQLGTIDPSHLTPQQEALLEEIARNCLQNAEGGKVVIGTMKGLDNGYIDAAAETGAVYYHNHQAVWDTLGELGEEQQTQAAWLINQKALQPFVEAGAPFEYTLKGIDPKDLDREKKAIKKIWNGASEAEIMDALRKGYVPMRIRELQELYQAGYELIEDVGSYRLIKP